MRRLGEFATPHVGMHDYVGEDLLNGARHFGLWPGDTYLAMHVRNERDQHFHIVRHYKPGTSTGVMAAHSHPDGIYFDPRKQDYLHGGTVQRFIDDSGDLHLRGALGMHIGAEGVFAEGESRKSEVQMGSDHFSIRDSGLVELDGCPLGPGLWVLWPWASGKPDATMHSAFYCSVTGTVYGEPVRGIVTFENLWSPPGLSWGDSPVAKDLMGVWNSFAQEFDDGSFQYGQFANWTSAGCFCNIIDNGKHVTSKVMEMRIVYRADGFAARMEFDLENGETWECVTEENGASIDTWKISQEMGQNFRTGHKGYCGRVGETRVRKSWYAIFEVFPDRLDAFARPR